jgi:5-methylcytosine-specific restriction protein A
MAKEFAKAFYNSKEWKECRKSFISYRITIDGGMCEHCKEELGYIVDHKVELDNENINDVYVSLNHDNLQYLCLRCHNVKTFGIANATRDDVMFNENGDLVQAPLKNSINFKY